MSRVSVDSSFRARAIAAALAACLVAPNAVAAPPEGKGKGKQERGQSHAHEAHSDRGRSDTLVSVSLSFGDARRIAVSHGYTGYASLPPGIRKNLARGKPLPLGIAKKAVPGPMLRELPARPGYEWRVYGSDLVLVALATGVIAEVLKGVFD